MAFWLAQCSFSYTCSCHVRSVPESPLPLWTCRSDFVPITSSNHLRLFTGEKSCARSKKTSPFLNLPQTLKQHSRGRLSFMSARLRYLSLWGPAPPTKNNLIPAEEQTTTTLSWLLQEVKFSTAGNIHCWLHLGIELYLSLPFQAAIFFPISFIFWKWWELGLQDVFVHNLHGGQKESAHAAFVYKMCPYTGSSLFLRGG